MKEFNEVGSIEEYDCFKGIEFAPEVKKLMELFIEAWQECKNVPHCAECKYWHKREKGSLLACLSERYAEKVIEEGYAPVVHGKDLASPSLFHCSVCGCEDDDTYTCDATEYHYCPNCGAKIDEKIPPERQAPASIYKCPGCGARFALSTKQMGGYFCHFCGAEMYKEEAKE